MVTGKIQLHTDDTLISWMVSEIESLLTYGLRSKALHNDYGHVKCLGPCGALDTFCLGSFMSAKMREHESLENTNKRRHHDSNHNHQLLIIEFKRWHEKQSQSIHSHHCDNASIPQPHSNQTSPPPQTFPLNRTDVPYLSRLLFRRTLKP